MNILVTGATGFIGKHLVRRLSSEKYSVRCLVREKSNDKEFLQKLNTQLIYGDLLDNDSLKKAISEIDVVFHLGGVLYSNKKEDYYNCNIIGTKNLLEICSQNNIKKFIYASSVAVYKPLSHKTLLTENSQLEPISIYGKSKLEGEKLVLKFFKEKKLPIVIVRIPIAYGPYQNSMLNKFFFDAIIKKKIYIFGNGNNLRSLCYIDNLIDGAMLIINNPQVIGKIYNISDARPYTFNIILKTLSEIIREKIKIVYLPKILADFLWSGNKFFEDIFGVYSVKMYPIKTMTLNLGCDISSIRRELSFEPSIDLKEGLVRTIEWLKKGGDRCII